MRNFGKETLNLLGCVSGMKGEFDPINYPRYDFNYQERLKTFRGIQVIFFIPKHACDLYK